MFLSGVLFVCVSVVVNAQSSMWLCVLFVTYCVSLYGLLCCVVCVFVCVCLSVQCVVLCL